MAPIEFLRTTIGRFFADERGATAIEYGLLVSMLSVALITTILSMGTGIKTTLYGAIVNALASL